MSFTLVCLRSVLAPVTVMPKLPYAAADATLLPQPEAVLDSRVIQKGSYRPKEEILVKWMGAPAEDAT